jgi:polyisoprenoid-binding protein YceI
VKKALLAWSFSLLISPCALLAAERAIDPAHSTMTIHVGKAGIFSAAGHEHTVSAPIAEGGIDDSQAGHVWLRVETARMTVLPEKDQEEVQSTMQKSVLESPKFPEIRFESTSIHKVENGKWTVTGNLTLHGKTTSITVEVHNDSGAYLGEARSRQTQFGIRPVSAAGGTVKVKDELKIEFVIVASK